MVLRLFAQEISARAGFWLLLSVTAAPLLGVGTILMTIDPPLVLCWMWALVVGWRAAQPNGRTRDWLIVGLAMGLGFLCKYSAAYQILCWVIFFALWPAARVHLRRPGPWLALLIFLICTLPVIIWNWQHGWITVHHVAGNAGLESKWKPTLRYFFDFIFTEAALLNPIFFIGAIWAMFGVWKWRKERPLWLFLFCMSAPVLLGHLLYSLHSRILPNWIAPAVPPAFCLMAVYWNERFLNGARWIKPFFATGLVLGFVVVAFMYNTNLIGKVTGQLLPGEKDPSRRVRVWKQTAMAVETEREKLETNGAPTFIIASHYGITGLFSFYLPQARDALKSQPLVYSIDSDEPRNQFYFFPEYNYRSTRKGQNALYVSEVGTYRLESDWFWKWLTRQPVSYSEIHQSEEAPARLTQQFESVTDLGVREIKVGDRVFHRVHLWACYNLQ